jgi:hypothetical protein
MGAEIGELGGPAGVALGAAVGALFGGGQAAYEAIKKRSPKEVAKRQEAQIRENIAREAGYNSYEEFAEAYGTTATYQGEQLTPEDNYYRQVRQELFGQDDLYQKPPNTEELRAIEEHYNEMEAMREEVEEDPYVRYQVQQMQQTQATFGPRFDYAAAAEQDAREAIMNFNPDGTVGG